MIKGEQDGDIFVILCTKCGKPTNNEYLGRDPVMPSFKATSTAFHLISPPFIFKKACIASH